MREGLQLRTDREEVWSIFDTQLVDILHDCLSSSNTQLHQLALIVKSASVSKSVKIARSHAPRFTHFSIFVLEPSKQNPKLHMSTTHYPVLQDDQLSTLTLYQRESLF
jgi:hypothetical protein